MILNGVTLKGSSTCRADGAGVAVTAGAANLGGNTNGANAARSSSRRDIFFTLCDRYTERDDDGGAATLDVVVVVVTVAVAVVAVISTLL